MPLRPGRLRPSTIPSLPWQWGIPDSIVRNVMLAASTRGSLRIAIPAIHPTIREHRIMLRSTSRMTVSNVTPPRRGHRRTSHTTSRSWVIIMFHACSATLQEVRRRSVASLATHKAKRMMIILRFQDIATTLRPATTATRTVRINFYSDDQKAHIKNYDQSRGLAPVLRIGVRIRCR